MSCPPCTGTCRQGRDCPANEAGQPLTEERRRFRAFAWRLAFGGCLLVWLGFSALCLRSCA